MSEYIICKGGKNFLKSGITVVELDDFLKKVSAQIWQNNNDVWTIKVDEHEIDYYLTKAQLDMCNGIRFEETTFYTIITELLSKGVKIAMWYDIYCEDLPLCNNELEVYKMCYNGIIEPSGMCEVYFVMA